MGAAVSGREFMIGNTPDSIRRRVAVVTVAVAVKCVGMR